MHPIGLHAYTPYRLHPERSLPEMPQLPESRILQYPKHATRTRGQLDQPPLRRDTASIDCCPSSSCVNRFVALLPEIAVCEFANERIFTY